MGGIGVGSLLATIASWDWLASLLAMIASWD